ncbi:MAG TPA: ABC transporter permease [Chloroflexia bacterium]|nr:ABC transporter permease [Chloroflexia bacterium]
MSLPRIMAITGRIIGQFRRDHRSLGLIFIVPIVVMSILGYVLRAQESGTVNVAVVNEDNPPAGQASMAQPVIDTLEQDENIVVAEMSHIDAETAVRNGSQRVALVFNSDFTEQFRSTRKANLEVIVEGSNPGQASGALATVGQAVQRSAPLLLKQMLPAAMSGAVPDGLPLQVETTRLYGSADLKMLDFFAPMFIAYIGFFLIFMLTSVSFLRERTQGTMERLSASPVTRLELVLGYMFGFGFFSMIQAAVLLSFTVFVLQVQYTGNLLSIFVVTLALVLGAVNLGIFLSAFARNELQAIQFIPLVILPQVLLSGLLWPVQDMPGWLQAIARVMPLTYAIEALTDIMIRGKSLAATWVALTVLFGFAALIAVLAATTVRREVA